MDPQLADSTKGGVSVRFLSMNVDATRKRSMLQQAHIIIQLPKGK